MKTYFKKIGALLMAAVMVLAMCTSVFADSSVVGDKDDTGSITVQGVEREEGHEITVTAYPIVLATYDANDNFSGYAIQNDYVLADMENPTVAELATIADTIKNSFSTLSNKTSYPLTLQGDGTYKGEGIPVGMYLISVSGSEAQTYNAAVASINYVNESGNKISSGNVNMAGIAEGTTIVKKSGAPDITKKVSDNVDENDVSSNSVNIGQKLSFEIKVDPIPDYRGNYPTLNVVDTLSKGLTYDSASLKVVIENKDLDKDKYTVETKTIAGDETQLTINFVKDGKYQLNDYAGKSVVITYSAILNENAAVNEKYNQNKAALNYTKDSNTNGNDGTKEDKTYTYTFDIDGNINGQTSTEGILNKKGEVVKNGQITEEPLAGATFTLYTDPACKQLYRSTVITDGQVTSDENGQLHIKGLAAGRDNEVKTYYLKETSAPTGYSVNTHVFTIELNAKYAEDGQLTEWSVKIDGKSTSTFKVSNQSVTNGTANDAGIKGGEINGTTIKNTKLKNLPSTGGMGTYLFTIIGVVIMAGAAGAFFISRKKGTEE